MPSEDKYPFFYRNIYPNKNAHFRSDGINSWNGWAPWAFPLCPCQYCAYTGSDVCQYYAGTGPMLASTSPVLAQIQIARCQCSSKVQWVKSQWVIISCYVTTTLPHSTHGLHIRQQVIAICQSRKYFVKYLAKYVHMGMANYKLSLCFVTNHLSAYMYLIVLYMIPAVLWTVPHQYTKRFQCHFFSENTLYTLKLSCFLMHVFHFG